MSAAAARALASLALMLLAGACMSGGPPVATPTSVPAAGVSGATAAASPTVASSPTPATGGMRYRVASTQPAIIAGQLLPYWVATDAGLFREQGLGLELVTLQSDQIALTSMANGEVDVLLAPLGAPLLGTLAGMLGTPAEVVIVGGSHNAFDQHLVAAADVATPADFVGKSVIISEKNTWNDFQTREALTRLGIDPDNELSGVWTGANQAERVSNLRIGNGQGIAVPLPLSALLAREGFSDLGDLTPGPPWPGTAIIVSRRAYAAKYDYLQRFLKGLLAGIQRTKTDPALAQQALTKYTTIDDPAAIEEAYGVYGDRLLERVPYLSMEGLQRAIDFAARARPAAARLRPATLVDHTILQRLESSGYLDTLSR